MLQGDAQEAGVVATAAAKRSKSPNPAARSANPPAPKTGNDFDELMVAARLNSATPQETKEASASDWATAVDPTSGKTYYYNRKTNVTSWTPPDLTPEPEPEPSPSSTLAVPGAGSSRAGIRTPKGRGRSKSPAPSPANSHGDFTVVINKGGSSVGLFLSEQTPGDGVYVTGVKPAGAAAAAFAKKRIDTDAGLKVTKVDGKPSPTKKDVIALFKASRNAVTIQFSLDPEGYAAVAAPAPAPTNAAKSSAEASGDSAAKAKNIKSESATSSPRAALRSPGKATTDTVTIVIHKGARPLGLTLLEGDASKGCYVGAVTRHGAAEPVLAKKRRGVDDGLRFAKINDKEASTKKEVAGLLKAAGAVVKLEFALDPKGYRAAVAEAPPASPKKERKITSAPSGDGRKVKSPVRAKVGAAMSKLDEIVVIIHKGSIPLGITVVEPQPGKGAWLDKVKATGAAAPVFKKKNLSPATGLRFKTVNGKACSTQKEVGAAFKLAGTTVKLVFINDPAGHAAAATPPHDAAGPPPRSSLGKEGRTSPERAVVTDASDVMPGAGVDGLRALDAFANLQLASRVLKEDSDVNRDAIDDIERRISQAAKSNDALTQMRRLLGPSDADGAVKDAQQAEEKVVLERHARLEKHAKAGLIVRSQWLNAEARVLKRLHAEHSDKMTHAFANLVLDFKDVLINLRHVDYVDEHRPTWEFHHRHREVRPVRKFSVYNSQQV